MTTEYGEVLLGRKGKHQAVMRLQGVVQCLDCGYWLRNGPARALDRVECVEPPEDTPLEAQEVRP